MKKLVLGAMGVCLAASVFAAGDIQKELAASSGERLQIDLKSGGSLWIAGWEKQSALVEVDFGDGNPKDFIFDISKIGSGIKIESDVQRRLRESNISVKVMVPFKYDLSIETAGGEVILQDITGQIEGETGGGDLDFKNLTGEIDFSTGGGAVNVSDSKLDGHITTGGGKVLIENVDGDLRAQSGGGEVVYKNVRTPTKNYPADMAYIRNAGGEINLKDAPGGADVSTGGGNIEIRSAGQFVKANTGGGDIIIDAVDGWVAAQTGAGTIEVMMIGDPRKSKRDVTLISGSGDIKLSVPSALSMDVDIELAITKGNTSRYRIISDFDLEQETTDEWDYDHGTPRKYILGHAKIADGRNRIKIRTVNGDVILKRGD